MIFQNMDKSDKKAGEFYTPCSVVALMVRILGNHEPQTGHCKLAGRFDGFAGFDERYVRWA